MIAKNKMKGLKRFLCFMTPFAIMFGIASVIHPLLSAAVAGGGFTIAYCFGENS